MNDSIIIAGIEFVRVPKGPFLMGSDNHDEDEKPQHTVDIPYDFWMGRFLITNLQYNQYEEKHRLFMGTENHPVINITWYDTQKYVKWLNEKYESQLPRGLVFSLPSEAEWEKAARGTDGRLYPWGNTFDRTKCNTLEGSADATTPVGLYSPEGDSPFGCADMAGNVWEWTRSPWMRYPYIAEGNRTEEGSCTRYVVRGGVFDLGVWFARCSFRNYFDPSDKGDGFRVAMKPLPS